MIVGALCALVLLTCASSGRAQSLAGPSVFYNVTYEGTAQFTVDGQDSCSGTCFSGPFHLASVLRWQTTFPAVQLSESGVSAMVPNGVQQLSGTTDETDTYCQDAASGDCGSEHCQPAFSAPDPGGAGLMLTGQFSGSALRLNVDAPWQFDPGSVTFGGDVLCQAVGPYVQFPDATRAVVSIPVSQLDAGTITRQVASTDPGAYQLASDCTAQAQADNSEVTSCTQGMSWSGTVTITPDCTSDAARPGGASQPPCIKKQQKLQASMAANDYRGAHARDQESYQGLGCGPGATNYDSNDVKFACAAVTAKIIYDAQMEHYQQALANDPPDPNYTQVVSSRPLLAPGLITLRGALPLTSRLIQRYELIAGLERAVVASQDRSSGAFAALSSGDPAARTYLVKQDSAVVSYAGQAAHLLAGQHRLALRAGAELRGLAARVHGRGARRLISAIERLALAFGSGAAKTADQLAAAALSAIGT